MVGVTCMKNKSFLSRFFVRNLGNQKGLSLVEMMVVVTIMSLVGLGMSSLLTNMVSIQKKTEKKDVLLQMKNLIEANIKDNNAWANSVIHATNNTTLNCLRDTVGNCADGAVQTNFNIYNRANTLVFQGASATGGFSPEGVLCNTFNATTGNNLCPFRYNLRWTARCPGGVNPCNKPVVHVVGDLVVNPANKSDPSNNINVGAYRIDFNRGDLMRYEPLEVRHYQNNGAFARSGTCPAGTGVYRSLQAGPLAAIAHDIGSNVVSSNATSFVLRPGTYICTVSAQVYHMPAGFKIELHNMTTPANTYNIASGMTGPYTSQTVSGVASFELNANARFSVYQGCAPGTPADLPAANFQRGIPSPVYADGNTFTRVSCVRSL